MRRLARKRKDKKKMSKKRKVKRKKKKNESQKKKKKEKGTFCLSEWCPVLCPFMLSLFYISGGRLKKEIQE